MSTAPSPGGARRRQTRRDWRRWCTRPGSDNGHGPSASATHAAATRPVLANAMTPSLLHPGLGQRLAALRRRAVHDPHNLDVHEVVRLRANDACEYCLLPTISKFEVE